MSVCESCYIFREIAESCLARQTDDLHSALKVNRAHENGDVVISVSETPHGLTAHVPPICLGPV